MKKLLKGVFLLCSIILLSVSLNVSSAQGPMPSPPSGGSNNGHDKGGNQGKDGGGAPIDGGLVMSLALIAGFGAWKWFKGIKRIKQSLEN